MRSKWLAALGAAAGIGFAGGAHAATVVDLGSGTVENNRVQILFYTVTTPGMYDVTFYTPAELDGTGFSIEIRDKWRLYFPTFVSGCDHCGAILQPAVYNAHGFTARFTLPEDTIVNYPDAVGEFQPYQRSDDYTAFVSLDIQLKEGANGQSFSYTMSAAPEPATWAMMIAGFGLVGATLRRRRAVTT